MSQATGRQVFNLETMFQNWPAPMAGMVRGPLEHLLGFGKLNEIYTRTVALPHHFCEASLEALGVTVQVDPADLARVPKTGPVLVVANHPYGGIEGLIMAMVLLRVRPDVKLMANYLLGMIPEMKDVCIFVNPFDSQKGCSANVKGIKQSLGWLRQGGLIGVFPSGEVSHLQLNNRRIADPKWNTHVVALAKRTNASVVPMYFSGSNGAFFQMAGLVHPSLRTVLLPRELVKGKKNSKFRVQIGNVITAAELATHADDDQCMKYLRLRTYALAGREERRSKWKQIVSKWRSSLPVALGQRDMEPIIAEQPRELLAKEIASLPARAKLSTLNDMEVYLFRAKEAPATLQEIGRLREITFRSVGEGTGKSCDLDQFDPWYKHIVLWNPKAQEVVGSYRLGLSDMVDPKKGRPHLYISTLFALHPMLPRRLSPAIELGRSFVRNEYQRSFTPLLLLWRGICAFISQRPKYRYIFGAVSMSATYSMLSRALIVEFLSRPDQRSRWAPMVTPRNRFVPKGKIRSEALELAHVVKDIEELSELISDIEPDGKGVPILLKHYLKMGSKPLAFNVDAAFGDCLDCFCVDDLPKADPRQLDRYMGKKQGEIYRAYHTANPRPASVSRLDRY